MSLKLSVVVCLFNEEDNIIPLIKQIHSSLHGIDYEIILVDDGSKDKTVSNIKSIKDPKICLIEFRKNYGQSNALGAGINYSQGEYIVTLDGDLQNDPSDIPHMLEKAESEGWDVVAGIRNKRKDDIFFRKIPSNIANWLIRKATGLKMKDYGCTLRVFKSDIAKNLGLYGEMHRFIPILAYMEGASITQVEVKHHARKHGKSKYGLNRIFKVMTDLILMIFFQKYFQRPMQLFGLIGFIMLVPGVILNIYLAVLKVTGHHIWGKPVLLLSIMLILGGLQFITIGIITEVQMRTYFESQSKKPYKIKRITNGIE